ncbi:MAG: DUF222 domain-containing protein [Ilumatobacteraceae bacterium]
MAALQRQCARVSSLQARLIARWDARKVWADDGSKSASARLAREAGVSTGTAKVEVGRARKLQSMPATAQALAASSVFIMLVRRARGAITAET